MSNFFKDIIDGFRSSIGYVEDPYRVKDVSSDQFAFCSIICREDFLILYSKTIEAGKTLFEIVAHKDMRQLPSTTFSLLRTEDKTEAVSLFQQLKLVLPTFTSCSSDLLTRDTLQEICQTTRRQPTWTPAHIAAYLGWVDCYKHEAIRKQINELCPETFITPLHLAVENQKLPVIQSLISIDVRLDMVDRKGDTVYHYAAITNKEIIQALVSREPPSSLINERNQKGQTPLHLACLADKPDCVKELLRSGADVNVAAEQGAALQCAIESSSAQCVKEIIDMYPNQLFTQDMKNGGTPLHWVKTPQVLEALIEFGCLVDAKNFQGDTALHVMITRNRLPCMVTLLSHGASPDIAGSAGNRPLHLAVKSGEPILVQALAVFDADTNLTNDDGDTPRHVAATSNIPNKDTILYILHAVNAKRCHDGKRGCGHGCASHGEFNGVVPEKLSQLEIPKLYDDLLGTAAVALALRNKQIQGQQAKLKSCNILCLDGGGIRGLVLIQTLSVLEKILGAPIMSNFNFVAGTSTGGILALALALGKSVRECRCLYFRLKDKVFVGMRPYDPEPLENLLQKEFGETTVMEDIVGLKVMVTAVLADRQPADLHLFRNYASPNKIIGKTENGPFKPTLEPCTQLCWRAARASGAAPTYFRALGRFLDGGLIANNPTLDALTEIHRRNLALKKMNREDEMEQLNVVVSLGTGKIPVTPITTIDVFKPDSLWSAAKIAMGVSALGQLLVDKVTEADGSVVERAQAWCSMIGVPYFRLNPPLTEDINLDEKDNKILIRTLWETNVYLSNRKSELQELATLLRH